MYLRLYKNKRAEVYLNTHKETFFDDYKPLPEIHLEGQWYWRETDTPCYVIDLDTNIASPSEISWTLGLAAGKYHALLIDDKLRFFKEENQQIIEIDSPYSLNQLTSHQSWLNQTFDDPLTQFEYPDFRNESESVDLNDASSQIVSTSHPQEVEMEHPAHHLSIKQKLIKWMDVIFVVAVISVVFIYLT